MATQAKRVIGTILAVLGGILSFGNIPDQWAGLRRMWNWFWALPGIDWPMFWAGSGGRTTLLAMALGVGLIAWDVPQRLWRRRSVDVVAEARRLQVRKQVSERLQELYRGSGSQAVGGLMTQVHETVSAIRHRDVKTAELDPLYADLLVHTSSWMHQAVDPILKAQGPSNDQELVVLLEAWGELFARYQVVAFHLLEAHFRLGWTWWVNTRYAIWREHDERLLREFQLFVHMEGCDPLAARLRNVGWFEDLRARAPRPEDLDDPL